MHPMRLARERREVVDVIQKCSRMTALSSQHDHASFLVPQEWILFRAHLELGEQRQDDLGVVGVAENALEVVQVPRHQAVGPGQALQVHTQYKR